MAIGKLRKIFDKFFVCNKTTIRFSSNCCNGSEQIFYIRCKSCSHLIELVQLPDGGRFSETLPDIARHD